MRNHATNPLPPIPFELVPLTPLPEVTYLPSGFGWLLWDDAVSDFDKVDP